MRGIEQPAYRRRIQRGFSLLEVLAAVVVMGLVFAGFVSAYATVMKHGSDAQLHGQAVAIAASYLDEILERPYRDPDDGTLCSTPEANRAAFDNVCDYDGLPQNGCSTVSSECPAVGACACDSSGDPIDGLTAFGVSVTVTPTTLAGAGGLQVRVDVTHDGLAGNGISLLAFRSED